MNTQTATNRELMESISSNLNRCIAMMNGANDEATRNAGALQALDILKDDANIIPPAAKVQITQRLTQALDSHASQLPTEAQRQSYSEVRLSDVPPQLSPVNIDGTQPARKPLTSVQYVTRAWLVWAGLIVLVYWFLSAVIR